MFDFSPAPPSATGRGHVFTRNPQSGAPRVVGEFVPEPGAPPLPLISLRQAHPEAYARLLELAPQLEIERGDVQRIEFAIVEGGLHLVDARCAERSALAAVKIAVDLVREGRVQRAEALLRVRPEEVGRLLVPTFDATERRQAIREGRLLGRWQGVHGGAMTGFVALDERAVRRAVREERTAILFVEEATSALRPVVDFVAGVVTRGPASVAMAARRNGWTCVTGPVTVSRNKVQIDGREICDGDPVSIDGNGEIFLGTLRVDPGGLTVDAAELLAWADDARRLGVRANVDSVADVEDARHLGTADVGLCRMENVLLQRDCLARFQPLLCDCLLGSGELRDDSLERDLEEALYALFSAAGDVFVIRLLDSPLSLLLAAWIEHEGLADMREALTPWLGETSAMQGMRCGRLAVMFPALMGVQMRPIAAAHARVPGLRLQVMVPGVCEAREIARVPRGDYEIGSMLELPRACLTADRLAVEAQFLSFGTGDLTETTCGISRYDAHFSFLPAYLADGILAADPFEALDLEGVGELMEIAVDKARRQRPGIEIGTCGSQASDPLTVSFCDRIGLDYVSVRPRHVPAARLAAAQSALRKTKDETEVVSLS